MSTNAYVNLLRFYLPDGTEAPISRFQNYYINEPFRWNGDTYAFLPFVLATGAGARGGERTSETLGLGLSPLAASIAAESVTAAWRAKAETVLLDPITNAAVRGFTSEWWECNSYESDHGALIVNLRSPFDAVQRAFPARVLSQQLVGSMPSTGSVRIGA